jgi:hypothetical protein
MKLKTECCELVYLNKRSVLIQEGINAFYVELIYKQVGK